MKLQGMYIADSGFVCSNVKSLGHALSKANKNFSFTVTLDELYCHVLEYNRAIPSVIKSSLFYI